MPRTHECYREATGSTAGYWTTVLQGTEVSCHVKQWQGIFVLTDDELRQTDVVGLSIKMDNSTFPRILPHTLRDELKEEL